MNTRPKKTYPEATQRAFERALSLLKRKLPDKQLVALAKLLDEGRLDDAEAIVKVLREETHEGTH